MSLLLSSAVAVVDVGVLVVDVVVVVVLADEVTVVFEVAAEMEVGTGGRLRLRRVVGVLGVLVAAVAGVPMVAVVVLLVIVGSGKVGVEVHVALALQDAPVPRCPRRRRRTVGILAVDVSEAVVLVDEASVVVVVVVVEVAAEVAGEVGAAMRLRSVVETEGVLADLLVGVVLHHDTLVVLRRRHRCSCVLQDALVVLRRCRSRRRTVGILVEVEVALVARLSLFCKISLLLSFAVAVADVAAR